MLPWKQTHVYENANGGSESGRLQAEECIVVDSPFSGVDHCARPCVDCASMGDVGFDLPFHDSDVPTVNSLWLHLVKVKRVGSTEDALGRGLRSILK